MTAPELEVRQRLASAMIAGQETETTRTSGHGASNKADQKGKILPPGNLYVPVCINGTKTNPSTCTASLPIPLKAHLTKPPAGTLC